MPRRLLIALLFLTAFAGLQTRAGALTDEETRRAFLRSYRGGQFSENSGNNSGENAAPPAPKPKPRPALRVRPKGKPKPATRPSLRSAPPVESALPTGSSPADNGDFVTSLPPYNPKSEQSGAAERPGSPPGQKPPQKTGPDLPARPSASGGTRPALPRPGSDDDDDDPAVLIEKSIPLDEEEPAPTPAKKSGWRLFGGGEKKYKHLTPAVQCAIRNARVRKGRWRYIVVHNSGTVRGSASAFASYHARIRKMPNGLAYHFVIGNGTYTGNGQIEVGPRWSQQLSGGHVHSDYLNSISLGICLVGDFNRDRPTRQQIEALDELVQCLRERVGRASGRKAAVKPHKQVNPARWGTDCPGRKFPYSWLDSHFN